ncbi:MAG TPA: hypothetical protein VF846_20470 [Thermoanaerobaculia bacterium]
MGTKYEKPDHSPRPWAAYRRVELTAEQKAVARAEAMPRGEEAARQGLYRQVLAMRGHVQLDSAFYRRLREDED